MRPWLAHAHAHTCARAHTHTRTHTLQEAINLALRCLTRASEKGAKRKAAVRIAASVLTKAAVDRGSKDNVTVVIVDLKAPRPTSSDGNGGDGLCGPCSMCGPCSGDASVGAGAHVNGPAVPCCSDEPGLQPCTDAANGNLCEGVGAGIPCAGLGALYASAAGAAGGPCGSGLQSPCGAGPSMPCGGVNMCSPKDVCDLCDGGQAGGLLKLPGAQAALLPSQDTLTAAPSSLASFMAGCDVGAFNRGLISQETIIGHPPFLASLFGPDSAVLAASTQQQSPSGSQPLQQQDTVAHPPPFHF